MNGLQRPALSRQALANSVSGDAPPCSGRFELDAFYEIDHAGLPPKSPIQLKAIRVVKVSDATRLDVTVRFPSVLSLKNYFSGDLDVGRNPELDERFVMGPKQAERILRRLISESEVDEEKHLESFWLVSPKALEFIPPPPMTPVKMLIDVEEFGSPPAQGGCLLTLKRAGALAWGVRRKVKYIERHRELLTIQTKKEEPMEEEEEEEDQMAMDMEMEMQQEEEEKEKEQMKMEEEKKEKKVRTRTRAEEAKKEDRKKKKKKEKRERKRPRSNQEEMSIVKYDKGSKERWSSERYEAAEMKLVRIMREKGAELGKPILRQALREEARKHIGDTGLLDHLLKHMAGKIVAEGTERFRRRHNAEGAMEYWLEPAELVDVRRRAGVSDPFWAPPPGWKPGDSIFPCPCGGQCKVALGQLKDEIASLKREIEQLSPQRQLQLEMVVREQSEAEKGSSSWQKGYKSLLEWKTKVEGEMAGMYTSFQAIKEELQQLKEDKEKNEKMLMALVGRENSQQGNDGGSKDKNGEISTIISITNNNSSGNNNVIIMNNNSNVSAAATVAAHTSTIHNGNNNANYSSSSSVGGSKRAAVRRSGFRICKPQGTFLWPNMASSLSPRTSGQGGLLFFPGCGLPTPPSASSATSAPSFPGPPSPVCRPPSAAALALVPRYTGSWASSPVSRAVGGVGEGKRGKEAVVWAGVTTDLALATPSMSYF